MQISTTDVLYLFMFVYVSQYAALPDYYKFILITVLILMTLIEAIRLYLGYAGNLQEKVKTFVVCSMHHTWNACP